MRALLPPRPRRRGRPGSRDVTHAISLLGKFRREATEWPVKWHNGIYLRDTGASFRYRRYRPQLNETALCRLEEPVSREQRMQHQHRH